MNIVDDRCYQLSGFGRCIVQGRKKVVLQLNEGQLFVQNEKEYQED